MITRRVFLGVAGLRVKSGRAVAVLLVGSRSSPQVVQRTELALSDPADSATRQPYHASSGTLETNERRLASRISTIRDSAQRSVTTALAAWRDLDISLRAAILVVGSLNPPEAIANEHIRAHALEGQLFREILAAALASHGVATSAIAQRELLPRAAAVLSKSPQALKAALADLGRTLGRPWQEDQKLAALAAWSLLPGRTA